MSLTGVGNIGPVVKNLTLNEIPRVLGRPNSVAVAAGLHSDQGQSLGTTAEQVADRRCQQSSNFHFLSRRDREIPQRITVFFQQSPQ